MLSAYIVIKSAIFFRHFTTLPLKKLIHRGTTPAALNLTPPLAKNKCARHNNTLCFVHANSIFVLQLCPLENATFL